MFYGICFLHIIPQKKCVFFYLFLGLRYTRHQRSAQRVAKSPVEHRSDGPSLQELPFLKAKWKGEGAVREEHVGKLAGRNMRIVMFIYVYWFITISWDNYNYHILSPYLGIWMLFLSQGPRRFLFFWLLEFFTEFHGPRMAHLFAAAIWQHWHRIFHRWGFNETWPKRKHLQPKCTGILWFFPRKIAHRDGRFARLNGVLAQSFASRESMFPAQI